jgi:predicted nuclease of predicted toxin-antitoxin system
VAAVRAAGHDVVSIMEAMPGVDDERVIAVATGDKRLLLTEDKDFGQLVFAAAKENSGVILIRYPTSARAMLSAAVIRLLADRGDTSYSRFAVLEPGRVRVTQLVA